MFLIDTCTTDPYFNLAAEEHYFRHNADSILILYINTPSIIVGKHQNCLEEINMEYVIKNKLPVIRRISGGGTVYHDEGNLNFAFITNSDEGKQVNFSKFIEPVNLFLQSLGVSTEVGEKNEIRSGGLKFSGNAEHVFRNRVMHHGTILFSSDLNRLSASLKKGDAIFVSRSVHSNRTNVGNLGNIIQGIETTTDLKEGFFDFMLEHYPGAVGHLINSVDKDEITKLVDEKYSRWDWNFAYGPAYEMTNSITLGGENCEVWIKVEKGFIQDCRVKGCKNTGGLETAIIGLAHTFDELTRVSARKNINLDKENILRLLG